MKIYAITNKHNKIIAISEYKDDIASFYIQNNLRRSHFDILRINGYKKCNNILETYNDVYIVGYDKYLIRACDYKPIDCMVGNIKYKLNTTIDTLKHIEDNFDIYENDDLDLYRKCAKKLKSLKKNINIRDIIYDYYVINGLRYDTFVDMEL